MKVSLKPCETQLVNVSLDTRSIAYFGAGNGVWTAPAGTYKVLVGDSSATVDLTGEVKVAKTITEKPSSQAWPMLVVEEQRPLFFAEET